MKDHIAKIDYQPTLSGVALNPSVNMIVFLYLLDGSIRQAIQHTIARPVAKDEVIGEDRHALYVEQNNIFPFFVLQGVYNCPRQVKWIQKSPQMM